MNVYRRNNNNEFKTQTLEEGKGAADKISSNYFG